MKQTLYSRILLIVSGILLGVAAVLTYTAAIRALPLFSFVSGGSGADPEALLGPLTVPILALTAATLLLGHLYGLFSRRSFVCILLAALIVPLFRSYCAQIDLYSGRYLFPALTFLLYPITALSVLHDATPEHRVFGIARSVQIGCEMITAIAAAAFTVLSFSDHVLFLSVLILVLSPFLPLFICFHASVSLLGKRYPPNIYRILILLSSVLPLSVAARPFHFDLSMMIARIGFPISFLLALAAFTVPSLMRRYRKRKEKPSQTSDDERSTP